MMLIEVAVRLWAGVRASGRDASAAADGVRAAMRRALLDGAPTADVIAYARRRIAHHGGGVRS